MMKHIKKVLSLALVLCMVFSLMPSGVFAAENISIDESSVTETIAEENTGMTEAELADNANVMSGEMQSEENNDESSAQNVFSESSSETIPSSEETQTAEKNEKAISTADEDVVQDEVENSENEIAVFSDDGVAAASLTVSAKPDGGQTKEQPFSSGTGGSTNFRIPALVTLSNGTLVAAADARWNDSRDGYGLDTIVSYSEDNGANWNYTFANYLGDNGNVYNGDSTAFIDPALVVTEEDTIYMLVDLYPHGTYIGNVKAGTGFDSNGHLLLSDNSGNSYDYFVGDFTGGSANIYKQDGTQVSGYTVDEHYNITGNGYETNLFFSDSPYQVLSTSYLYLTKSTDGGKTWSAPQMLNIQVKNSSDMFYGVGPGRGLVTSTGRIMFPCYTYTTQDGNTSVIYSDDGGATWSRSADMTSQSSEAALVEADGRIYMFTRHGGYYVSEDDGSTWSSQKSVGISYTTTCQLSAITYSKKIDGKTAILLSAPTSNRNNGKIFVGLVQDDGSINWAYTYTVNSGTYQYSCLTELNDGSIGLLYENGSASIKYSHYLISDVANNAQIGEVKVTPGFVDSDGTDISSVVFEAGATEAQDVVFQGLEEGQTLSVTSSNEKVVTASVTDDKVTLSPVGAGMATVTGTVQSISRAVPDTYTLQVTVKSSVQQITPGTITEGTKPESITYELDTDGVDSGEAYLIVAKNTNQGNNALKNKGGADGASTDKTTVTVSDSQVINLTDDTAVLWKFEVDGDGKYTIKNQSAYVYLYYSGGFLGVGGSTATLSNEVSQQCSVTQNTDGSYYIYGKNRYLTYESGPFSSGFDGSKSSYSLYLYKKVVTPGGKIYKTDVTYLAEQMDNANSLQEDLYTTESWSVLDSALSKANELNNVNEFDTKEEAQSKQNEIDAAAQELADAIAALQKKPVDISVVIGGSSSVAVSGNLDTAKLDTSVATVSIANGTMTVIGISEGNTSVVVGDTTYNITVTKVPDVLDINTTPFVTNTGVGDGKAITKLTTSVGLTFDIDLSISGSDVEWSIADTSIATVDQNGNVTGVKAGETTLTVSVDGVAYTIPVVIRQDATSSSTKIYDFYLSEVTDTTVYMSISTSTDLIEVQEGEAIYISFDANANTAVDFFGKPYEGYALTRMSSTNSAGDYMALNSSDPEQTDFYNKDGAAGKNQRDTFGDTAVANMVKAALDKDCDGGMGWTRPSNKTNGASSDLTFRSEKLPTVEKEVATVNGVAYTEGMIAHVGEKVVFNVTVTQYAAQDNITYSNVTLKDNLSGAVFANSTSATKTITDLSNTAVSSDTTHTYQVEYTITDADLDKTIVNTVDLAYTYQSAYSSGSFGGTANADARFTAASFNPKNIVIDFGLPVTIDYSGKDAHGRYDLESGTAVYGDVSVSGNKVTYTPNTILQDIDTVTLTNMEGGTYTFKVYPATTVYYEEGFAELTGNGWSRGSKGTGTQTVSFVGSKKYYGYDNKYAEEANGPSNASQITSTAIGDDAVFKFTGTGVDIYANCTTEAGSVNVLIRDSEGSLVKLLKVDTKTGSGGSATEGQAVNSYSLPIVSVNGLTRDNYTVTIRHCKTDANETESGTVYIDGFKVYGTIDESTSVYAEDEEANPNYVEVRNSVLKALNVTADTSQAYAGELAGQVYDQIDGDSGAIIISTNVTSNDNAQDLLDNGPKNEIFLRPNESLVFDLGTGITSAQIGLKAVNADVTYKINDGNNQTMTSSTDMFYKLKSTGGGSVTITNVSGGILSITDLKWFGELTSATVLSAPSVKTVRMALMSLGFTEEPTTADATLNISVADYTGAELASTVLTANGTEGEKNVFAAADIAEAAKSVLPEGYALADETAVADQTVVYGEDGTVTVQTGKVATLNVTYKKLFGKTVGTVVLTKVQTSDSTKATFSASEIRAAVPEGYTAMSLIGTSVKYGSESSKTVYVY